MSVPSLAATDGLDPAEVGPRRQRNRAGGQRLAGIAQPDQEGEGETAAGRVAGDDHAGGIGADGEEAPVGGDGVVDGGGVGGLGRQAVVGAEHPRAGPGGEVGEHRPVRLGRTDVVAAAVEVHDDAAFVGGDGGEPVAGDATEVTGLDVDGVVDRHHRPHHGVAGPEVGQVGVGGGLGRAEEGDDVVEGFTGHGGGSSRVVGSPGVGPLRWGRWVSGSGGPGGGGTHRRSGRG